MKNAISACGLLFCVLAMSAANSNFDPQSLSGNLQEQCTNFSAAVVEDTSFTISAMCNEQANTRAGPINIWAFPKFDLSGDVRWDVVNHTLSWDTTVSNTNQDISAKCKPKSTSPFTVSTTDVTLSLSCSIQTTGAAESKDVSLGLNENLKVGTNGAISRR